MKQSNNTYDHLSDYNKKTILEKKYVIDKQSFGSIADELGTYANKLRRDAKRLGIPIRDKSQAQKNALSTGKHKHPTKGTSRSDDVKNKIGVGVMKNWDQLDESEKNIRVQKSKERWESLSADERKLLQSKASSAVRIASKQGSKLEKYFLQALINDGYKVDFHKEQSLSNTKLQLDLFLPTIGVVIEIDGPSHFEPVWGEQALARNKAYDAKKEGLITGKGWYLIRVAQTHDFSNTRANILYKEVKKHIEHIQSNKSTNKLIYVKDNV